MYQNNEFEHHGFDIIAQHITLLTAHPAEKSNKFLLHEDLKRCRSGFPATCNRKDREWLNWRVRVNM
jgi:hypothetical protein